MENKNRKSVSELRYAMNDNSVAQKLISGLYDAGTFAQLGAYMKKNTTKVRNIRGYLLTALYNAPTTIEHYYQSAVQHDLYGQQSEPEGGSF